MKVAIPPRGSTEYAFFRLGVACQRLWREIDRETGITSLVYWLNRRLTR